MSTINGIGTKLLRESEIDNEGPYIATNWFVIGLIPLIPIATYKVYEENSDGYILSTTTKYKVARTAMNFKRILPILSIVWISIFLLVSFFIGIILVDNLYVKLLFISGVIVVISIGVYKLSCQEYIDISSD
jgi:hypothetical protein